MEQWQYILERFLRHECTDKENKLVYHALRGGLIDDLFRQAIDSAINDKDTAEYIDGMEPVPYAVMKEIRSRMNFRKANRAKQWRIISGWLKIAAAVLITLSVSWMFFNAKTSTEQSPIVTMNTITVPTGQTVSLTLSDGTKVWLNARTTMKFPGVFTGDRREIIIDGEGFFDVAYDPERLFIVHTGEYSIQALGTQFNVEAYSHGADFSASLLEGLIQITSAIDSGQTINLHPNTMARQHEGYLISEEITDFDHFRWREGLISFTNMPFTALMAKFEKCYGIKIVVQNNRVKEYMPTGKFRKSDGIDYALRVLQRNFRFIFERDEENHVIYIR